MVAEGIQGLDDYPMAPASDGWQLSCKGGAASGPTRGEALEPSEPWDRRESRDAGDGARDPDPSADAYPWDRREVRAVPGDGDRECFPLV